jgi:replicative superfamily II helicase
MAVRFQQTAMALLSSFIGAGKYSDPDIPDLIGSSRDAIAIHALFADSIPDGTTRLLVDEQATVANIRDALRSTLDAAGNEDVVVFSFSGHGSHDHRLAAFDTALSDLGNTTIGMDELAIAFRATNAKAVLCVLDCCFSGVAPAKVLESSPIPRDVGITFDALIGEGRILLTASGITEPAYEIPGTRHGILTKALLDMFMAADGPVDLLASLGDVMRTVQAEAARLGVTQTPILFGTVAGGLIIPKLSPGTIFYAAFPELRQLPVTANFNDLLSLGFPAPVIDEWATRYPQGLNRLQLEAVNRYGIAGGKSLLVVAPTSSGKTFIGELGAAKAISESRKAAFLLPYKALVNEKFEQFSELYGVKLGMRVIRCSGDYSDEVSAFVKGKYDLALLTYEMFLQIVVSNPFTLGRIGLLVVDEAQFITDPNRGISVELLLTLVLAATENGVTPQIIALSAVIGDTNNFHSWLRADLLLHTERPVPLIEGVIDRSGTYQFLDENGAERTEQLVSPFEVQVRRERPSAQDLIVPLVKRLVSANEKVIIFRNARGPAQGCANYLARDLGLPPASQAINQLPDGDASSASLSLREALRGGTAFHNSNLTREEKVVIEQAFRDTNSPLRILAATTTVAAGINTPASTVILAENEFVGEDGRPFTVAEYKNMAGRAGRLGFNEKGKSIIYAETPTERHLLFNKYVRGMLERLHSSFDPQHLDTWLVRLLAQIGQISRSEVSILLVNTYAGYLESRRNPQWHDRMRAHIDALVTRMIGLGLIDVEGDKVSLSLLGRSCGQSSLAFESAMRLIEIVKALPSDLTSATNLMALMQGLPAEEMGYTPLAKGTRESARVSQATQRFGTEIVRLLQRYAQEQSEFYARCKRASILFDWISGVSTERIENEFSTSAFAGRIEYGDIRRFADLTRYHLQSASNILAVMLLEANPQEELNVLVKQLEIGIPSSAVELLNLPIPLRRGEYMKLAQSGVIRPAQVWEMSETALISLLGKARAHELTARRP